MQTSELRFNSYGDYLRSRFGKRVHKIPINAGFTCPNRDGSVAIGGCTYCNIDSFTPEGARARIPIKNQIEKSLTYLKQRFQAKAFIAYFQPYSNTYAPLKELVPLYEEALSHPEIVGLSIGTRPDCVEDDKLDYLAGLSRRYFVTVEYGIESVHDATLQSINRGHDFACTVDAIERTAARDIKTCAHLVLGFPNETRKQMLQSVEKVSTLPLDFIKIHNLHIVRYTELARQYAEKPFHVFTFPQWVQMSCDALERLNPEFKVERLYGDAPLHLLIQPQWGKSAAEIIYAIQQEMERRDTFQGKLIRQEQFESVE